MDLLGSHGLIMLRNLLILFWCSSRNMCLQKPKYTYSSFLQHNIFRLTILLITWSNNKNVFVLSIARGIIMVWILLHFVNTYKIFLKTIILSSVSYKTRTFLEFPSEQKNKVKTKVNINWNESHVVHCSQETYKLRTCDCTFFNSL